MKTNFWGFLFLSTFLVLNINCSVVRIVSNGSEAVKEVTRAFDNYHISYEIAELKRDAEHLYVIFDTFSVKAEDLPPYYIVYQSRDLTKSRLNDDYYSKLLNAVAVWDCSYENIKQYSQTLYNYYYFPKNYEFADPVILSCTLPLETLNSYKNLLIYSNKNNSDISSHLPTLFCYVVNAHPEVIVEAGVRGGESTLSFIEAMKYNDAALIGIDVDPGANVAYKNLERGTFLCMDDLNFLDYYRACPLSSKELDILFLDTSHTYEQTIKEITLFAPLLKKGGMLMFHDSNVTPINGVTYWRINDTYGHAGGNTRGVTKAFKEYFNIPFDESKYCNFTCIKDGVVWNVIHYPFCNGFTVARKL